MTVLPEEFQCFVDRAPASDRERIAADLGALLPLHIESYEQLVAALPLHDRVAHSAATWALRHFGEGKAVPPLLRLLENPDPSVRANALYILERVSGTKAILALIRHMKDDPDGTTREMAAHSLGFIGDHRVKELAFEPLLAVLEKETELPAVRAQAAESLGNHLWYGDQRTRRFRRAVEALLRALDHPAPELRFWACFALGRLKSRRALPKLQHLAETDAAICPGWWAVKEEAGDAVGYILTGKWPDRDRLPYPAAEDQPSG